MTTEGAPSPRVCTPAELAELERLWTIWTTQAREYSLTWTDMGQAALDALPRLLTTIHSLTADRDHYARRTHEIQEAESRRLAQMESDLASCRGLLAEAKAWLATADPADQEWSAYQQAAVAGLLDTIRAQDAEIATLHRLRSLVADKAFEGLHVDGGHHKQWFLEQVLDLVDPHSAEDGEPDWPPGVQP